MKPLSVNSMPILYSCSFTCKSINTLIIRELSKVLNYLINTKNSFKKDSVDIKRQLFRLNSKFVKNSCYRFVSLYSKIRTIYFIL